MRCQYPSCCFPRYQFALLVWFFRLKRDAKRQQKKCEEQKFREELYLNKGNFLKFHLGKTGSQKF